MTRGLCHKSRHLLQILLPSLLLIFPLKRRLGEFFIPRHARLTPQLELRTQLRELLVSLFEVARDARGNKVFPALARPAFAFGHHMIDGCCCFAAILARVVVPVTVRRGLRSELQQGSVRTQELWKIYTPCHDSFPRGKQVHIWFGSLYVGRQGDDAGTLDSQPLGLQEVV